MAGRDTEGWGRTTVETACPLDCPDTCSLAVSVAKGRIVRIDGSARHDVTAGFICGKVRRFAERIYGDDRLRHAGLRDGPKGQGRVQARRLGTGARRRRRQDAGDPRTLGSRGRPALLVRRLERPGHAGHRRRAALPPLRRQPAGAHRLRRTDDGRHQRTLRPDAGRRLCRLPARAPHHGVGRQPVRVRHPSGAAHTRGDERRRRAGRHRSAPHRARQTGGHPSRGAAGHRRRGRAGAAPVPLRARPGGRGVSRRPHPRRGCVARARRGMDRGARRRRCRRGPRADRARGGAVRGDVARGDPLRLGAGAEPERRQRGGGRAGPARCRRQVRRARRRLLDEQLGRLAPRPGGVDRGGRTGHAAGQHEPAGSGAHRVPRPARADALRLQRQPGRHHAGPEPRAAGPRPRRPVHRGLRSGHDRHGALGGRRASRHHFPGALRHRPELRRGQPPSSCSRSSSPWAIRGRTSRCSPRWPRGWASPAAPPRRPIPRR